MKTNCQLLLLAALVGISQAGAFAQTTITYDVTARIDTADLLLIRGSQARWYHPGSGAAVGRHAGHNDSTTISSELNGSSQLNDVAWTPDWSAPAPAQLRHQEYSSTLTGLSPALPADNVSVNVSVLSGRGSATVQQMPSAANDWTLGVRFADGFSGSRFLTVRIAITTQPLHPAAAVAAEAPQTLRFVASDSTSLQLRWPTSAESYFLESVTHLPALPEDWARVTNEPVISDGDFILPVDLTEPQRFFRLRKF